MGIMELAIPVWDEGGMTMYVQNLAFQYKRNSPVLIDVSFKLRNGVTVLLGENGSGKTTLIKNIVGLLRPQHGMMTIPAEEIRYLPQDFSIYPSLRVKDILRFVAEESQIPSAQIYAQVQAAACKAHVQDFLNERFDKCSLGTQKRIGIAATLIGTTRLAVLDEPTAGIDPKERNDFYQVVKEAFTGKYVLLSTHILDDLDYLADNVLMLSKGKIVFDGSYQEYCSLLHDRLYTITADQRPGWLKEEQVLLCHHGNHGYTWRFVSSCAPPQGEKTDATTADIWTYITRGTK